MSNIFQKALTLIVGDSSTVTTLHMPKDRPLKKLTERELIQLESEVGTKLFGEVANRASPRILLFRRDNLDLVRRRQKLKNRQD